VADAGAACKVSSAAAAKARMGAQSHGQAMEEADDQQVVQPSAEAKLAQLKRNLQGWLDQSLDKGQTW